MDIYQFWLHSFFDLNEAKLKLDHFTPLRVIQR